MNQPYLESTLGAEGETVYNWVFAEASEVRLAFSKITPLSVKVTAP